jgi:hypothetical protein
MDVVVGSTQHWPKRVRPRKSRSPDLYLRRSDGSERPGIASHAFTWCEAAGSHSTADEQNRHSCLPRKPEPGFTESFLPPAIREGSVPDPAVPVVGRVAGPDEVPLERRALLAKRARSTWMSAAIALTTAPSDLGPTPGTGPSTAEA